MGVRAFHDQPVVSRLTMLLQRMGFVIALASACGSSRACPRPDRPRWQPRGASWKLMSTCRWKSGRGRCQDTLVAAHRRMERSLRRSVGSSLLLGRCNPPVRSMKRSLPRRHAIPAREQPGAEPGTMVAKAMEGVKRLEMQPRRTRRRKGRGMVGQPAWEQERPVSAPAVRPRGCQLRGGLGAPNPISGGRVKWGRAERESERPIVPMR
jgi:hypothetical protein